MSAPPSWYGVLSMHQANRNWWWWMARSTSNATLASCAKTSFPGLGQLSKKNLCLYTPQIARNTRNFLAGEEVDVMQRPAQRPYLNIFGTRWGCLSEIWINLLPQWLGYGRPSCKLGAQCPLKGLRSLYEACLDDWGPWWPRGEVIPDITRKLKDPINYNIPWNISLK